MKNTLRRVLGAAVLLAAGSCIASASSISYYVDVFSTLTSGTLCTGGVCPTATSATYNSGVGSTVALTLPQFNQLGNADEGTPSAQHMFTLTSVQLGLSWKMLGEADVFNTQAYVSVPSGAPYNVTFNNAQAFANMTFTAGGTQVVGAGNASTGSGIAPCCNNINGVFSTGKFRYQGEIDFPGLTGNGNNSQFAANLAYFMGIGNNTFSASVVTDDISAGGNSSDPHSSFLSYGGLGQMGGIATITYNYTEVAVPEPGTMALMGSSLIGIAMLIRKRVAKR